MTGIGIRRKDGETWLDAALRLAAVRRDPQLADDIREHYNGARARGVSEEEAALAAALEWDVAELLEVDE